MARLMAGSASQGTPSEIGGVAGRKTLVLRETISHEVAYAASLAVGGRDHSCHSHHSAAEAIETGPTGITTGRAYFS